VCANQSILEYIGLISPPTKALAQITPEVPVESKKLVRGSLMVRADIR